MPDAPPDDERDSEGYYRCRAGCGLVYKTKATRNRLLSDDIALIIPFYKRKYRNLPPTPGGGGAIRKKKGKGKWVGVWAFLPKTLSLFMTKKAAKPYPLGQHIAIYYKGEPSHPWGLYTCLIIIERLAKGKERNFI